MPHTGSTVNDDLILTLGQVDILPFQLHQMPVKVDAQLSSTVYSSLGIAGPRHLVPGVPQRGTDPRQQFSAPKRLCDIVIRPQIEGLDLIPLPGPGPRLPQWALYPGSERGG